MYLVQLLTLIVALLVVACSIPWGALHASRDYPQALYRLCHPCHPGCLGFCRLCPSPHSSRPPSNSWFQTPTAKPSRSKRLVLQDSKRFIAGAWVSPGTYSSRLQIRPAIKNVSFALRLNALPVLCRRTPAVFLKETFPVSLGSLQPVHF